MKENKIIHVLPEEPPVGLLESMATCYDHSFGLQSGFETEEQYHERRKRILYEMKKYYDEVAGYGYFKYDNKIGSILSEYDFKNLKRFEETTSDGEGYDVMKSDMERLAEIGVVRHHSRGIYSLTSFGQFVIENDNISLAPSKLKTEHDSMREVHDELMRKMGKTENE